MDGFLIAVGLAVIGGVFAAVWLARVIYLVVGRALGTVYRAFDRDDPG